MAAGFKQGFGLLFQPGGIFIFQCQLPFGDAEKVFIVIVGAVGMQEFPGEFGAPAGFVVGGQLCTERAFTGAFGTNDDNFFKHVVVLLF